jgi:hypothetical protein
VRLRPDEPGNLLRVGAGLSIAEFRAAVDAGVSGYRGLGEYMALVAQTMGWRLDHAEELIEPLLARQKTMEQCWASDNPTPDSSPGAV